MATFSSGNRSADNDDSSGYLRSIIANESGRLVIDQQGGNVTRTKTTTTTTITTTKTKLIGGGGGDIDDEQLVKYYPMAGNNRAPLQQAPKGGYEDNVGVPLVNEVSNGAKKPTAEELEVDGHKLTSKMATFANLIKGNIGTGILSLPNAMANAGLVVGTIGLVLAGFLCTYCMHQLLAVYRKVHPSRPGRHLDYADVAEAVFEDSENPRVRAFARTAKGVINFFLIFTQIGICCVYLNFCPTMIKEVVESYTEFRVGLVVYQAVTAALLIPYCFVRTLDILAIFSLIANILTMVCLVVIMQYVFRNLQVIDNLPLYTSGDKFFLYFGSVMFAYESITFVLPFECKMKDRHSFHGWNGLMSLAMVAIIAIYTTVAFFGYLAFGADARLILRNMPDHWVYHSIRVIYGACIFLSYSLQLFIPIQIVLPTLRPKLARVPFFYNYCEHIMRVFIVVFTFALSAMVPCLEEMIALVGALAISTLALVFPPILEIVAFVPSSKDEHMAMKETKLNRLGHHHHHDHDDPAAVVYQLGDGRKMVKRKPGAIVHPYKNEEHTSKWYYNWIVIRGVIIILIGVAASVVGTYVCVIEIYNKLSNNQC